MRKEKIPYQSNDKVFTIRRLRENFDAASINEYPHRHEFTEFIYLESGKGSQEIDGVEYHLEAHKFYIITKGQVHQFFLAKAVQGYLIRFHDNILPTVQSTSEGFYYNLLYSLRSHNELMIPSKDRAFVKILLERMLLEYEEQNSRLLDLSMIQHLLYPLIILLNRHIQVNVDIQDYQQDLYADFINLLETSFKQHHDLGFYAKKMGLSTRKLTEICQTKSGKTAKKVINDRVLVEAKRLLKYTSLPLKEISDQIGYKDLAYFCRYFKKSTGQTPTFFKRNS